MEIDGKLIAQYDYSKLINFDNTGINIILPERWHPTVYSEDLFGFPYAFCSLSSCGCELKASEISEAWLEFEKDGLPLSEVIEIFVLAEIHEFLIKKSTPIFPFWIHIVQLIDLKKTCEKVENLEGLSKKHTEIRRNIKGIVRKFKKDYEKKKPINLMTLCTEYSNILGDSITAYVSELTIAKELTRYFDPKKIIALKQDGSDINIEGISATRLEVKRRIDDLLPWCLAELRQETEFYKPLKFDGKSLFLMLCYLAFPPLKEAFEKQNAQIVFVDVSYTLSGAAESATQSLFGLDFSFNKAIKDALELTDKDIKVVVPFASINGKNHTLIAESIPYEIIRNIGGTAHHEIKEMLFSWDKIPGDDNGRLIEFHTQKFGIDWVKTAKIEKIDDGRTISVSTEKNYLSLRLNDDKTKVNLRIDDGRIDELNAKMENSKLNIYKEINSFELIKKLNEFSRKI